MDSNTDRAPFRLLMISAMYENGGNMTQRFLDGHPQMKVYPFESQLGTALVKDALSAMFPVKYRWPVFDLNAMPAQDYHAVIDEECKVRARTPHVSKFRHFPFAFSDDDRLSIYEHIIRETGRSRANNIAAFFQATFLAWQNFTPAPDQVLYVGYSPIIIVDAEAILRDFPDAHVLHVVRNPWSAYADTKKRAVPLSLGQYMLAWTLVQYHALLFKRKYPDRVHVVRAEDVMADPCKILGELCDLWGLVRSDTLKYPSWNGMALKEIPPWGVLQKPDCKMNRTTALALSVTEREDIANFAWQYIDAFDYRHLLNP